ncbi:MAG: adenylate kinase [Chloroflexi bacterium]|nr:adenylate kinase [Chloroflexota bacterium]
MTDAKYVILLGPPGVGKGTQAKLLEERYGLAHVASGDLFREHISKETSLGKLAKSYIDRGELVPDDVTVQMVMERIGRPDCEQGVVFDGFPRTEAQASALTSELSLVGKRIAGVVLINAKDDVLVRRLTARWICPIDGAVYNLYTHPPTVPGRCDNEGAELVQRSDDTLDTVRRRLDVYRSQTAPLVDYYRAKDMLSEIDGSQAIGEVEAALARVIERL